LEPTLGKENSDRIPAVRQGVLGLAVGELCIVPLVLFALAIKSLLQFALLILIRLLDYTFPILLQLVRFPLFTVRILGDGVAAIVNGVVRHLPVSGEKRDAWAEALHARWAWLRQWISYKVFEDALHHSFENGMAWVFRKCRLLTPGGALLVIIGAVLWLPLSFGLATAIHAILIAEATSLPAWMQLLHPVATIIAKSKLLVLPAYPAAWPQAKKHPLVRGITEFYRNCMGLPLVRRAQWRYWQIESVIAANAAAARRTAALTALGDFLDGLWTEMNELAAWFGKFMRMVTVQAIKVLSQLPLVGAIVKSYVAHYRGATASDHEKFSETVSRLYTRWSINFSAEYYEAKDRDDVAQPDGLAGSTAGRRSVCVSQPRNERE
jgi:hypothetical protein